MRKIASCSVLMAR